MPAVAMSSWILCSRQAVLGPPRPSGPCPAEGSPARALGTSRAMGAVPTARAAAALPAPARFCSEEGSRLVWRFWQHRLGLLS